MTVRRIAIPDVGEAGGRAGGQDGAGVPKAAWNLATSLASPSSSVSTKSQPGLMYTGGAQVSVAHGPVIESERRSKSTSEIVPSPFEAPSRSAVTPSVPGPVLCHTRTMARSSTSLFIL